MAINLSTQLLLKGIQPVDKFTGTDDEEPVIWLHKMDELFTASKVLDSDRRNLLPMYFGEDVKKWYRVGEHSEDYGEFKQQFITAFTSSVYKLKIFTKLVNRRQGNTLNKKGFFGNL
jgi:hypothetical protein